MRALSDRRGFIQTGDAALSTRRPTGRPGAVYPWPTTGIVIRSAWRPGLRPRSSTRCLGVAVHSPPARSSVRAGGRGRAAGLRRVPLRRGICRMHWSPTRRWRLAGSWTRADPRARRQLRGQTVWFQRVQTGTCCAPGVPMATKPMGSVARSWPAWTRRLPRHRQCAQRLPGAGLPPPRPSAIRGISSRALTEPRYSLWTSSISNHAPSMYYPCPMLTLGGRSSTTDRLRAASGRHPGGRPVRRRPDRRRDLRLSYVSGLSAGRRIFSGRPRPAGNPCTEPPVRRASTQRELFYLAVGGGRVPRRPVGGERSSRNGRGMSSRAVRDCLPGVP